MAEKDAKQKFAILFKKLAIGFLLILITFLWYTNTHWSVLMGDDLLAANEFKTLGLGNNLVNSADVALGKIRPISKILLYIVYRICNLDYAKYYVMGRLLMAGAALIIYKLMKNINLSTFNAIVIAGMLVICPFSAYGAWQYIGVCEIWSLLCCTICGFYLFHLLYETDKKKISQHVWLISLWFALLIFNAERFMYLSVVFILVISTHRAISIKDKLIKSAEIFLPIIIRYLFLQILGSNSLATGRGSITTSLTTLIPYALKGLVNMLGFSLGDSWHGGFTITQIPSFILIVSALRVFICLGVLYDVIKNILFKHEKIYFEILMWYSLSFTSLFSYALVGATSGEDRFLWVSYSYYLIGISRYLSLVNWRNLSLKRKHCKSLVQISLIVPIFFLVCSNYYYLKNKIWVHYRYSQEMAETAIENIHKLEDYEIATNIACVGMKGDYIWVLRDQLFFKLYLSEDINTYYFDSFDELNSQREVLGVNTIVIYPSGSYEIPVATDAVWIDALNY